jgi:hypothetical protein
MTSRSEVLLHRPKRNGFRFGARDGSLLITCPACGAWVGSRDGERWYCDDGHVIYPKEIT